MKGISLYNLFLREGGDTLHFHEACDECKKTLTDNNFDGNGDNLCLDCYDGKYSGCYGGGCIGGE